MRRGFWMMVLVLLIGTMQPIAARVQPVQIDAQVRDHLARDGHVSVIVGLKPLAKQNATLQVAQQSILNQLNPNDITAVKQFKYIPAMALTLNAAALDQLASSDDVAYIIEDRPYRPSLSESTARIGAPAAWAAGYKGAGQAVAILDSGVQADHPFLGGRVVAEACFSSNRPISVSLCREGESSEIGAGSAAPCTGMTHCENGTHVAGIAAGFDNTRSGVAPEAKIIAVQVFSKVISNPPCAVEPCIFSFVSDQIAGLEYVYSLRNTYSIAAVNLGVSDNVKTTTCDTGDLNAPLKATIDNLRSANIAVVVGSGDDASATGITSPACISSAISVGSTTDTDPEVVSGFSNSASFLSLLAPGEVINSSIPGGTIEPRQGTSMAAAHVTGAWAVMRSKNQSASVDTILNLFKTTGVPITDSRNAITKPRIQLDAAIAALLIPQQYTQHVFLPLVLNSNTAKLLKNGDFEQGRVAWVESSSIISNTNLPIVPHSGAWLAWLGRVNDQASTLSQTFTVPDAPNATLQYWIRIQSSESVCSHDVAYVTINSLTKDTINLCAANNTSAWTLKTIDLSAYRGLSVNLQFTAINDAAVPSSLFIDDVAATSAP